MGFGYTDLSYQMDNLPVLKKLINSSTNSEAQNGVIKKYLAENKVEKIIRF